VRDFRKEWQPLGGNKAKARTSLHVAVDTLPKNFVRYLGAILEWRRLRRQARVQIPSWDGMSVIGLGAADLRGGASRQLCGARKPESNIVATAAQYP
jgi:hypothetical protein